MLYAQTAVLSWVLAVLGFEGLAFACFTGSLCPQCGQELRQGALGCQCGFLESAEGMRRDERQREELPPPPQQAYFVAPPILCPCCGLWEH